MAVLTSLLPTLIPFLIAIALYLTLTFLLLPIYRRHRARYSQYLPVSAPAYSRDSAPSIFRRGLSYLHERILFFPPSLGAWQRQYGRYRHTARSYTADLSAADAASGGHHQPPSTSSGSEGDIFGEEEGESLVGFDLPRSRRAEQGRVTADVVAASSDRRLSRELEEGFRDDSEEEEEEEEGDGGEERREGAR